MKLIWIILTTLLISFFSITVYAQQAYTLKGTAGHMAGKKVELLDFFGDKNTVVASTTVDKDGLFQFPFSDDSPVGMYRLRFDKGRNVDIIYNRKDIELSISKPSVQAGKYSLSDGIDVLSSGDSSLYYGFLRTLDLRRKRTALLNQLKLVYPTSKNSTSGVTGAGEFRSQIEVELGNLHNEFEVYIQQLIDNNPDSYTAKIIRTMKTPVFSVESPEGDQREWLKEHFWDSVDLSDATLLHSTVIPSKVFEYILLYNDNRLNKEYLQMAFIEAVDDVLFRAQADETVFSVVLDIVTRRFEKSQYELVLTYITENYILSDSGCEDSEKAVSADRADELRDKVETIKRMAVGNTAPEIDMPQQGLFDLKIAEGSVVPASGSQMKLSSISAEYTLVLFWASWCPHCQSLLSAVKGIYEEYSDKGLEILAISIDKDRIAWQNSITKGQYSWINYSELNGWNGKAAKEYGVWSTPRMYLLDREKRIIAKPVTVEELKEVIAPLTLVKTENME
ncbi:MAG: redoxin domain-containing protein [Candidatus Scalindua sp.]|nr:redoxin domain-containing protein [Candidatus Scalindua sp.]